MSSSLTDELLELACDVFGFWLCSSISSDDTGVRCFRTASVYFPTVGWVGGLRSNLCLLGRCYYLRGFRRGRFRLIARRFPALCALCDRDKVKFRIPPFVLIRVSCGRFGRRAMRPCDICFV